MTDRAAIIQGFRELADFLERHPDVEVPQGPTQNVFLDSKEEVTTHARAASWEKDYSDSFFMLRKRFSGDVTLDINAYRETVCKRVVTGTKVLPARPEQTIDVVEWVCDEPLLQPTEDVFDAIGK